MSEQIVSELLKDAEPSTDLGPRPEFRWLPKTDLFVDEAYQRKRTSKQSKIVILKILEYFNWASFKPLSVTPREDGGWWVIDGQHQSTAALCHPLVDEVPCWIVSAPTQKEQARAFVRLNSDRVAMTPLNLFKAELAAGDPDATQIVKVCKEAGITILVRTLRPREKMPPCHTQAISTIRSMISTYGEGVTLRALKTMAEAFAGKEDQIRPVVIKSLVTLFRRQGQVIDQKRLIQVLRAHTADSLIMAAMNTARKDGGTTQNQLITMIARAYNKGLTSSLEALVTK